MTDKSTFLQHLRESLAGIEADGLMKRERLIEGAQGARVRVGGRDVSHEPMFRRARASRCPKAFHPKRKNAKQV